MSNFTTPPRTYLGDTFSCPQRVPCADALPALMMVRALFSSGRFWNPNYNATKRTASGGLVDAWAESPYGLTSMNVYGALVKFAGVSHGSVIMPGVWRLLDEARDELGYDAPTWEDFERDATHTQLLAVLDRAIISLLNERGA